MSQIASTQRARFIPVFLGVFVLAATVALKLDVVGSNAASREGRGGLDDDARRRAPEQRHLPDVRRRLRGRQPGPQHADDPGRHVHDPRRRRHRRAQLPSRRPRRRHEHRHDQHEQPDLDGHVPERRRVPLRLRQPPGLHVRAVPGVRLGRRGSRAAPARAASSSGGSVRAAQLRAAPARRLARAARRAAPAGLSGGTAVLGTLAGTVGPSGSSRCSTRARPSRSSSRAATRSRSPTRRRRAASSCSRASRGRSRSAASRSSARAP